MTFVDMKISQVNENCLPNASTAQFGHRFVIFAIKTLDVNEKRLFEH